MCVCVLQSFLEAVGGRGKGALELVAMDMKARGMYVCRTLSFAGTPLPLAPPPSPFPNCICIICCHCARYCITCHEPRREQVAKAGLVLDCFHRHAHDQNAHC